MPESPELRASDADRARAESALREGYAEGRLTLAELDERLGRAAAAATSAELVTLIADLEPHRAAPPAPASPAVGRDGRATASLVLGVAGLVVPVGLFIAPLLAIVLGVVARRDLRVHPGRAGRGAAEAGSSAARSRSSCTPSSWRSG